MTNKKLIKIFICVFLVFLFAIVVLNSMQPEKPIAIITVNGEKIKSVDLSKNDVFYIKTEFGTNTVVVENEKIYVKDASCPDGVCIRHGVLHNKYDSIVCLPNKLVIEYENKSEVIDIVTGRSK